eukprot:CAMPEP_0180672918 /NCGR_PEP_ID=MMETSP1037_2-20121125/65406_1 /TAXON_ID=632150 /ORGANISM="Azadinium spinosum, Strain 3D9" /LENGTH=240 /DNA_ID=CAMNT_0022702129 /DNA_START=61 /DNA_END=780 /DNA_ORIENTATION=-
MSGGISLAMNPMVLRLVRVVRLLRLLRLVRTFQVFDVLHLLVGSIRASANVLLWTVTLLFLIMLACSLFLNFSLEPFILDETKNRQDRLTAYEYFGTVSRGLFTMFELTTGNWVPVSRFLIEDVNEWFVVILLFYRCTVQLLFSEADESGDGFLSREEFQEVLSDTRVKAWLSAMELEVRDAEVLFDLVDDGDHRISAEELVHGFARLKGNARSLDLAILLHELHRLETRVVALGDNVMW